MNIWNNIRAHFLIRYEYKSLSIPPQYRVVDKGMVHGGSGFLPLHQLMVGEYCFHPFNGGMENLIPSMMAIKGPLMGHYGKF